jgi:hypothetical protein
VTLARRVPERRARVRTADGVTELTMLVYDLFASTELLGRLAMAKMLAKLSTRRYRIGLEPVRLQGASGRRRSRRCRAASSPPRRPPSPN